MAGRQIYYSRAENEAIYQEMERDPAVIIMGEDIAGGAGRVEQGIVDAWGGPFGATKGLIQRFGPRRVIDTPICEMSFVGAGVGAAMTGLRPIVELLFVNFVGMALEPVMNQAAFMRYMLGGQASVPLVIKTAIGATAAAPARGGGSAAHHSGVLTAIFAHIPGLKVVAPSDAYTAKGLMIAAIRDDDPVVYCSHRRLLNTLGEVPEEPYVVPIGRARVVKPGRDVTLVGISCMTQTCLQAAALLQREGMDAEVVDLLSIAPLDEETLLDSVSRTKRLVVVDEDHPRCSVARDIAAMVCDKGFDYLDAPVKTVTGAHSPVPYSGVLEALYVPTAERVAEVARGLR